MTLLDRHDRRHSRVMLRALLAGVVAALMLSAPAVAAPLTRPGLPSFCREWGGEDTVALACDPGKRATGIHLRLGAGAADPSYEPGVAQLSGREPLLPGETLTLTWSHPSSHAVLAVKVASPQGPRDVVLDLRARPARVDVIAQAAGALQVTTSAGSATVPAAPAPAEATWEPRTAHGAATQLLAAVDRMQRSAFALRTLCAALDRDVFSNFELLFGDPQRYPCVSGLAFNVFGDENVPRPTSTVHRGAALAVHRGRALLSTTLTHRYTPSSLSDPKRLVVHALVGLGVSGSCVALRSAGPLPARFEVHLRDDRRHELAITVADGRVLVQDAADEAAGLEPIRGVAAHLDADGLVLALPLTLSGTLDAMLSLEVDELSYSDDARVRSAPSRRCARRTCSAARPPRRARRARGP